MPRSEQNELDERDSDQMDIKVDEEVRGEHVPPDQIDIKTDEELRRQHVPYILNGELYRIESQVGDNVTVKCCSCPPDRIYRGSVRSTGNFHMHIKRRHASLLGKLHEMKVAALVERRDRIMKNRRIAKCRKKSTTPVANTVAVSLASLAVAELPKSPETRELKIKTVFQRHKQEHDEQEEAAAIRTSVSMCDSSLDNSEISGKVSCATSNQANNNINIEALHNERNSPDVVNTFGSNQSVGLSMSMPNNDRIDLSTMIGLSRLLPFNLIKPEQHNQLAGEQPQAIDLSRSSSLQSDDTAESALSNSVQNVQIEMSGTQELAEYGNGAPREVLQRIDNTLADIKDELQARNQIERKRLLFDMAKFKYLHPNFNFDASQ